MMMTKNKLKLFVVLVLVAFSVSVFFAHSGAWEQQGTDGKNASLFESEWVAYNPEDNKDGDQMAFAKNLEYRIKCIQLKIDSIPVNADIYLNEVYLGKTPLDDTIHVDSILSNNARLNFRIHKEGYLDAYFEVDINAGENSIPERLVVDQFIELRKIEK